MKVQREAKENVMIRKLQVLYESNKKYFNQYVQNADFTSRKKNSCNKLTLDLLLERYGNEDLDVLGEIYVGQNVKPFLKTLFYIFCQFWFKSKSKCFTKWLL